MVAPIPFTWLCLRRSLLVVSPFDGLGGSTAGEATSSGCDQRRNGRAYGSLTARGGGLPGSSEHWQTLGCVLLRNRGFK